MTTQNLKLKTLLFTFHFLLFTFLFVQSANADTITNGSYSIDVDTIDTNPPPPTPKPPQQVLGSVTQITQPLKSDFTTGPNYTVNESTDFFGFGLSQDAIDLGVLSASNPVIRTSEIYLTNSEKGGQVLTYENHPLFAEDKKYIPDITCDNGACTETTGAPWESNLTYGFGYRCDSSVKNVCDQQFTTSNIFKQYPDSSRTEQTQPIILSNQTNGNLTGKVTYKANISGTQTQEGYYNSITYLAVPNF